MPLEIQDLTAFGAFVAHQAQYHPRNPNGPPTIFAELKCAEVWGEYILRASRQYGQGVTGNVNLGLSYAQKPENSDYSGPIQAGDTPRFTQEVVDAAATILDTHWVHSESFKKWYSTQVLVAKT